MSANFPGWYLKEIGLPFQVLSYDKYFLTFFRIGLDVQKSFRPSAIESLSSEFFHDPKEDIFDANRLEEIRFVVENEVTLRIAINGGQRNAV